MEFLVLVCRVAGGCIVNPVSRGVCEGHLLRAKITNAKGNDASTHYKGKKEIPHHLYL